AAGVVWKCFRLELKAGTTVERTVELTSSAELRGVVVDRAGYAVPGARVSLDWLSASYFVLKGASHVEYRFDTKYQPDGTTSTFVTDLQGRFAIHHVYASG